MQQTWRVSLVGRAFGIVVLVLAGIVASAIIVSGLDLATKIVSVAIIVGFAAYAYVNALRPSITLTNSELVIRNKFKTYRIDLNTIARVDAGYYGIGVQTSHGQVVHGWAVQKSNLARWLGRRTRADLVVEAIEKEVTAADESHQPREHSTTHDRM
ncbi:hypothetical protein [Micromonospora inositola]|uniref:PH domain-containing protein n=1 Tax=Micromonospora inositola TaxID=47865 RepID=A0A1C5K4S4_9ACTN|nr:hypothetical protein [Micromonospora inositola]SCG77767.1 hypothetical protein GA0070613_6365 [Micromonospora inositola]